MCFDYIYHPPNSSQVHLPFPTHLTRVKVFEEGNGANGAGEQHRSGRKKVK